MSRSRKRILVIGDQQLFLHTISRQLNSLGYTARTASSAYDGIETLLHEQFDLVMVDLMMPEVGGLLAIRAIRQEHPAIPILVVSGYYDKLHDTLHGTKIDGMLPKPIRLETLRRTLREILSKKSRRNCHFLASCERRRGH